MTTAIIQAMTATARRDRKKNGLTINKKSKANKNETPNTMLIGSDCGSMDKPNTLSRIMADKMVTRSTDGKIMNSHLQNLRPYVPNVLMMPNDQSSAASD